MRRGSRRVYSAPLQFGLLAARERLAASAAGTSIREKVPQHRRHALRPGELVVLAAGYLDIAKIGPARPTACDERVAKLPYAIADNGPHGWVAALSRTYVEPDLERELGAERAHHLNDEGVVPPDRRREGREP